MSSTAGLPAPEPLTAVLPSAASRARGGARWSCPGWSPGRVRTGCGRRPCGWPAGCEPTRGRVTTTWRTRWRRAGPPSGIVRCCWAVTAGSCWPNSTPSAEARARPGWSQVCSGPVGPRSCTRGRAASVRAWAGSCTRRSPRSPRRWTRCARRWTSISTCPCGRCCSPRPAPNGPPCSTTPSTPSPPYSPCTPR